MLPTADHAVPTGLGLRHPATRRATRRKQKSTQQNVSKPHLDKHLAALNVSGWTTTPDGTLTAVRIGPSDRSCAIAHTSDGSFKGGCCSIQRNGKILAAVQAPPNGQCNEVEYGLKLIERILSKAKEAGIRSLEVRIGNPRLVHLVATQLSGAYHTTAGRVREALAHFDTITLATEASSPIVKRLRALKAVGWRKDELSSLMMVRFGNAHRAIHTHASSDAGVRNSCCTFGGVIRERSEVIGMVMERASDTDNVVAAELLSLARLLEEAKSLGVKALAVSVDCKAVLGHVVLNRAGECGLAAERVRSLLTEFEAVMLSVVPREQNKEADSLATSARSVYAPEPVVEPVTVMLPARKAARLEAVKPRSVWGSKLRRVWSDITWENPLALGLIAR